MTPRSFCRAGEAEMTKAAAHVGLGLLAALCCGYNVVAWWFRREGHLAANAAVYGALTAFEVRKVMSHVVKPTYDEIQAGAVLTSCESCGRSFFMTHPQASCVQCRGTSAGTGVSAGEPCRV
jgi:hypothetical protein